jgi:hypothetical protein
MTILCTTTSAHLRLHNCVCHLSHLSQQPGCCNYLAPQPVQAMHASGRCRRAHAEPARASLRAHGTSRTSSDARTSSGTATCCAGSSRHKRESRGRVSIDDATPSLPFMAAAKGSRGCSDSSVRWSLLTRPSASVRRSKATNKCRGTSVTSNTDPCARSAAYPPERHRVSPRWAAQIAQQTAARSNAEHASSPWMPLSSWITPASDVARLARQGRGHPERVFHPLLLLVSR